MPSPIPAPTPWPSCGSATSTPGRRSLRICKISIRLRPWGSSSKASKRLGCRQHYRLPWLPMFGIWNASCVGARYCEPPAPISPSWRHHSCRQPSLAWMIRSRYWTRGRAVWSTVPPSACRNDYSLPMAMCRSSRWMPPEKSMTVPAATWAKPPSPTGSPCPAAGWPTSPALLDRPTRRFSTPTPTL